MIEIRKLTKKFDDEFIIKGVDLTIKDGEKIAIIGPSGCGKSTFLRCINCLEDPTSGSIVFDGVDIADYKVDINKVREKIGMVFQQFNLFNNKTVIENITLAPLLLLKDKTKEEIYNQAYELLDAINLKDKANCYPSELSGGEQQRVAFARALVNNPEIIIADEPTGNNDPKMSLEIMDLLVRMNKLEKTVIVVTHEKNLVDYFRKRVITINDSSIVSDRIGGAYDETI